jgi:hypothetical protein
MLRANSQVTGPSPYGGYYKVHSPCGRGHVRGCHGAARPGDLLEVWVEPSADGMFDRRVILRRAWRTRRRS